MHAAPVAWPNCVGLGALKMMESFCAHTHTHTHTTREGPENKPRKWSRPDRVHLPPTTARSGSLIARADKVEAEERSHAGAGTAVVGVVLPMARARAQGRLAALRAAVDAALASLSPRGA